MSSQIKISGGGKGGGGSFKNTPDNLRSNDTFEGVLGMGIGPMKGPTRGLKSIKMDGTAIENETGELNFGEFIANVGNGDPTLFPQVINLKLGAGSSPTSVGLSLTNTNTAAGTGSPGPYITKTLPNTNADFIDLRFIVSQLFRQDSKGIYTTSANLEIEMKPVGSTNWITPNITTPTSTYEETGMTYTSGTLGTTKIYFPNIFFNNDGTWKPPVNNGWYTITGKTSSPAVYELRIGVPNTGAYADKGWDVRVRLREREIYDNDQDAERRSISWETISAVYSTPMGTHEDWRGVTWLQLYGKASDQLTGVPEITGEWDTKIVNVPPLSVFNPDTRQYTGAIWDGSWVKAWTNDPAWVINDAISDPLAGLSVIASGSYLNKWDALELSKWCSTLVPDGNGGMHPRYSMNIAINEPQKAEEFIRYLAGAVGALAWDEGGGQWRAKVDKPDAPVDIFTLQNIENEFVYSNTDVDTRYNDIIGQFKNSEMDYRQDAVRLYDNASIAAIGRKPTTVALVGCTNRQEALRRVMLRLRSTVNEFRVVSFVTNRRGRNINQLDTILVADNDLGDPDQRTTGRMVDLSADRKTITLRDSLYLAPGVTYTLKFSAPNSSYNPDTTTQPSSSDWRKPTVVFNRTITTSAGVNGLSTKTISIDTALPVGVDENLQIALSANGLPSIPKLFRVTNVTYDDDGEHVAISAIEVDTEKWDIADNVEDDATVFQDLRGVVPVPQLVPGQPLLTAARVTIEQGEQINLQARWVRPSGAFISGFRVQYSVNGGALQTAVDRQQLTDWELPNAGPGDYHVEVCTIDRRGNYSLPLKEDLTIDQSIIEAAQIKYSAGDTLEELKPAEAGATDGMNAVEEVAFASAQSDITTLMSFKNGFSAFGLSFSTAADAAAGRTALGLGSMAVQNSNSVAITGGDGSFGTLSASSSFTLNRVGAGAAATSIIDVDAGQSASVQFRVGGVRRWDIGKTNDTESGGNAGSNFYILRRSDAGSSLGNWIAGNRATGLITVGGSVHPATTNAHSLGGTSNWYSSLYSMVVITGSYTYSGLPAASSWTGGTVFCSDLGGGGRLLESDGANWRRLGLGSYTAITTDAGATFTYAYLIRAQTIRLTAALTANRTATLTAGAPAGVSARFVRDVASTGAFNWAIGSLKNLAPGTWCDIESDGTNWFLSASGAL